MRFSLFPPLLSTVFAHSFAVLRSLQGPIYYYPDCEHDSDHTTTPKFSLERTNHNQGMGRIGAETIGKGPKYNLRNGKVGTKTLAIGDVTHKTAQWATCGECPSSRGGTFASGIWMAFFLSSVRAVFANSGASDGRGESHEGAPWAGVVRRG